MTTFNSSSTQHQSSVASNTANTTSKSYKLASNGFTVQRPPLGIHQNGTLSNMESPYYTTTRQQVQKTRIDDSKKTDNHKDNMGQSGIILDDDILDEDHDYDVEIIMHEGHYHTNSSTCTSSGLNKNSTPVVSSSTATAPYQEQRQQNTDLPEVHIDLPLQRQLEYYFSRQNLANDSYLVSQMDPDLYVPIATIAKFKRVMDLTFDMDHIVTTLRRSSVVTVDESGTKVKPNVSMQRTTVILRDVPDATKDEISQFLQDINSLPIINIKNEYADMWYITFKSEEDALKMMSDTRGKLFKGQYVAARMKSEPVVGSIQARKSALQAGSSSSSGHTTGTHFNQGHHTYNHHTNMNMKNYVYNGPYYPSNSHVPYISQYPSHHPGNSYSNYIPNGNHRGGRYMNNHVNNRNHNNNRRSNMGGRGWYKNNYGGMGRSNDPVSHYSTLWTDRQSYQLSSQSQRYQQPQITTTNDQPNNTSITPVLNNDASEEPLTETPSTSTPSRPPTTYPQSHHYQSSNHHRGNKNGRSGQWQHKNYSSPSHPAGSNHTNHTSSNQPSHHRHRLPSSWKNDSMASSSPTETPSLELKHQSSDTTNSLPTNKLSESISSTTTGQSTTEIMTSTPIPVSPSSSINTTTGSGKDPASGEHQKDATRNRKPKRGDKKKKNRKPLATSVRNEHKHQEQPDLQSGTFFPPLPGTKSSMNDIDPTAKSPTITITTTTTPHPTTTLSTNAEETSGSSLLEKRLSIADIVKKGHESTKKQSQTMNPEDGSTKVHNQQKQQQQQQQLQRAKTTSKENETTKKRPQPIEFPQQKELFPLLCPVQDSPLPSSSFSYADILKKKESETN